MGEDGWKARKLQKTGGGSLFSPLGALALFALVWSRMSGFPGMTKEEENGSRAGKETDFSVCTGRADSKCPEEVTKEPLCFTLTDLRREPLVWGGAGGTVGPGAESARDPGREALGASASPRRPLLTARLWQTAGLWMGHSAPVGGALSVSTTRCSDN